jgi:hypothetical protein
VVAGDLGVDGQQVQQLLFAGQVEVVDAGARPVDCLPVGVGGVGKLVRGSRTCCCRSKPCWAL